VGGSALALRSLSGAELNARAFENEQSNSEVRRLFINVASSWRGLLLTDVLRLCCLQCGKAGLTAVARPLLGRRRFYLRQRILSISTSSGCANEPYNINQFRLRQESYHYQPVQVAPTNPSISTSSGCASESYQYQPVQVAPTNLININQFRLRQRILSISTSSGCATEPYQYQPVQVAPANFININQFRLRQRTLSISTSSGCASESYQYQPV
jgi:hypothetical protein